MKGINLRLPFLDTNYERPSKKTDVIVEEALTGFFKDNELSPIVEYKNSGLLGSFMSMNSDPLEKNCEIIPYKKLEEELKKKNNIIKELQNANSELKKIIKLLQNEK